MSDYYEDFDESMPLFSKVNQACVIEKATKPEGSDYSQRLEDILAALKAGSLTCVDVESRWHRGQAAIGDLRSRGHVIDTVNGTYKYVGLRCDMVKSTSLQELYYQSAHWQAKSKQRKDFDGWKCTQCKSEEELETHHWRYDLFNESLSDLVTLCRQCHETIHSLIKGSSVHFPRYVTNEIAERITSGTDN